MFAWNINYIAGALALFFITLAVYKALSQKAVKRAAAAKSLAQSAMGQASTVSLHNPYPNGAPIPEAPLPSDTEQKPDAPPSSQATPRDQSSAFPSTPTPEPPSSVVSPPSTPLPEDLYKWN